MKENFDSGEAPTAFRFACKLADRFWEQTFLRKQTAAAIGGAGFAKRRASASDHERRLRKESAMSRSCGPIEMICDAPPYEIVKACAKAGFRSPLDVAWRFLAQCEHSSEVREKTMAARAWRTLFGGSAEHQALCQCGATLPRPRRGTFVLPTEQQLDLHLAQCHRCGTIYWEVTEFREA